MELQLTTQLAPLSEVLAQNTSLADRAVMACRPRVDALKAVDLTTVDAQAMEANDAELSTLQAKLKDAFTIMNDRRKPLTQRMDEVKAMFTAEEKKVIAIGEEVKTVRDNWQREKSRRNQEAEAERQRSLQVSETLIDAKAYMVKHLGDRWADAIVKTIYRMHDAFNGKTIDQLDAYGITLGKWTPALDQDTWTSFLSGMINPKPQLITGEKLQGILNEVVATERPRLASDWNERLTKERDTLIEMIPSRKRELEKIAGDVQAQAEATERQAKERADLTAQMEADRLQREKEAEEQASIDKVNASFDSASEATPVVGIAKGTVVKRKYQPKSHKGHVAIIQWWVTNCMNQMTLDELQSKLSFMRTAADKALNDGRGTIEAEGLEVVEDFSTRTTRTKKEVAA